MALLLRRGAALAARSFRAAAAASSAAAHRLPAAGSLAGAGELAPARIFLLDSRRGFAKGKKSSELRTRPLLGPPPLHTWMLCIKWQLSSCCVLLVVLVRSLDLIEVVDKSRSYDCRSEKEG